MPIKHASAKHLRQTVRRTSRNHAVIAKLRSLIKTARKAIAAKDKEKAQAAVRAAAMAIDKAAQNKVMKKNTASRYKSRLTTALNKI